MENIMNNWNLEIEGFGLINEAKIEIGKINVVGGVNSSGKSTASKLLYCFLKANSLKRNDYILQHIIDEFNYLINYMDCNNINIESPNCLDKSDDLKKVLQVYDNYKEKLEDIKKSIDKSQIEFLRIKFIESLINGLINDGNVLSSYMTSSLLSEESLRNFVDAEENSGVRILQGHVKFFSDLFESIIHNDVNYKVEIINGVPSFKTVNGRDHDWEDDDFYYLTNGTLEKVTDVFYMGIVSLFDLDNYINSYLIEGKPIFNYEEHVSYLIESIHQDDSDIWVNEDLILFKEKLDRIMEGSFHKNSLSNFSFYSHKFTNINTVNTSSGIKQIGLLQLLLKNNKFKPGTFLIIDEPEVNLHPEWQFKFAEILVLLAKELDVTLYLNSHSPMFIEAIEVLTQYYGMDDYTNFYMTEQQDDGRYNFVKVEYDNLYELYDNLAKPFEIIEMYRLKTEYEKGNY